MRAVSHFFPLEGQKLDLSTLEKPAKADIEKLENAPAELNQKFVTIFDNYKWQIASIAAVAFGFGFVIAKLF